MKIEFLKKFSKDIDKISRKKDRELILGAINLIKESDSLRDFSNIKKLTGFSNAYRLRVGNIRIGVFWENNVVQFARVAHRKDIYKIFP